jgi:hypothetical protein
MLDWVLMSLENSIHSRTGGNQVFFMFWAKVNFKPYALRITESLRSVFFTSSANPLRVLRVTQCPQRVLVPNLAGHKSEYDGY